MIKKKYNRKYKTPINIYSPGGWAYKAGTAFKNATSIGNLGSTIGSVGGAIGSIVGTGVSNAQIADTSGIESNIDATQSYTVKANDYDSLMSEWSAQRPLENISWKDVRGGNTGQRLGNTLKGALSGASAGATLGGPIGAIAGAVAGLGSGIAGWLSGNKKAKKKAEELNTDIGIANEHYLLSLNERANNIDTQNDLMALSNYMAKGGNLRHQHGGIFNNNVTIIDNGGTHEENPNEGVQIGVDNQGIPNMVEEGEVIWNDYVFSNRLKPTKEFKNKYKVKGETFADVAKAIQKESEERPNDPISKRGLEDSMSKLLIEQENMRIKDNISNNTNKYKYGSLLKGTEIQDSITPPVLDTGLLAEELKPTPYKVWDVKTANNSVDNILRYAPVLGSAVGAISSLFDKPDYSNTDLLMRAASKAGSYTPIKYSPVSNYLEYNPLDINYYTNKLNAQAGATRRAITNQGAGNRATTMAGLLAADYNAQSKYGDLLRQAEEFNLAQRQAVEGFNRETNTANSTGALQAAMRNQVAEQSSKELGLKGITQATAMRNALEQQRSSSMSANFTSLFDNLGAVGKERMIMNIIKNNPSLLYDYAGFYKGNTSACGGYLTVKNKKRRK